MLHVLLCCCSDVRIDSKLNSYLFSKGVRSVPHRVRVRLSRKRNEDEDAAEKVQLIYTILHLVLSRQNVLFRIVGQQSTSIAHSAAVHQAVLSCCSQC
jgi:Ribosomal protein L31e